MWHTALRDPCIQRFLDNCVVGGDETFCSSLTHCVEGVLPSAVSWTTALRIRYMLQFFCHTALREPCIRQFWTTAVLDSMHSSVFENCVKVALHSAVGWTTALRFFWQTAFRLLLPSAVFSNWGVQDWIHLFDILRWGCLTLGSLNRFLGSIHSTVLLANCVKVVLHSAVLGQLDFGFSALRKSFCTPTWRNFTVCSFVQLRLVFNASSTRHLTGKR